MTGEGTGSPLSRVARGKAKLIRDERGNLGVVDIADHAPFLPVRLFWICDVRAGTERGGHAHKACSQFLMCLRGRIRVDAMDGVLRQEFTLEQGDFLNLVPGIFATELFLEEGSLLAVLCDRPYEADDYIFDKEAFVPGRHRA
jgi:hypothetical protein